MPIELTADQARVLAAEGDAAVLIDPDTKQTYRLVREDVFRKLQALPYDASPWTPGETAALAAEAFGKLDDTDYADYLRDGS
jgi:hypothetical protein